MIFWLLVLISIFKCCDTLLSIERFGAIAFHSRKHDKNDINIAKKNSIAIKDAIYYANNKINKDRVVVIPYGKTFYFSAVSLNNLYNITLQIDGTLIASDNIKAWPEDSQHNKLPQLRFENCSYFAIQGRGSIDGSGYNWWWFALSLFFEHSDVRDNRGDMLYFRHGEHVSITGVTLINSPKYHINLDDLNDVTIEHIQIIVDTKLQNQLQYKLQLQHGLQSSTSSLPVFPLNTDGIDPKASNVYINNITVTNYDDAIAIKPCDMRGKYCLCATNITIRNIHTMYSVGISIGTVSPNRYHSCISHVAVDRVVMEYPLKGIYIKTNPNNDGNTTNKGSISHVHYTNIFMNHVIWWPIWIGPQQQHQPVDPLLPNHNSGGEGHCDMTFPLTSHCVADPLVTVTDITLENVTAVNCYNSHPGVIICPKENPCVNMVFDNVYVTKGNGRHKAANKYSSSRGQYSPPNYDLVEGEYLNWASNEKNTIFLDKYWAQQTSYELFCSIIFTWGQSIANWLSSVLGSSTSQAASHKAGYNYITENVYGNAMHSEPSPKFDV